MESLQPICILLLAIVMTLSCNGQKKTDVSREKIKPLKDKQVSKTKKSDFDPFFTGTSTVDQSNGPKNITRNILQDKKGNYWLATWEGIIRYDGKVFINFTNKEELRRFRVFSLLEDQKGKIWFGTIGAGVYIYDGQTFINKTSKDGLVNNDVGCIYEDRKGNIWLGTRVGISLFDGKTFTNFTSKDGLADNDVNSIIEDQSGLFWIGARGAACTYDGKSFTQLNKPDGAPFTNVRSIIEDRSGNIWLGGNDGLWKSNNKIFTKVADNFTGYIYEDKQGNIWTSMASYGNASEWSLMKFDAVTLNKEVISSTPILQEKNMFFGIIEDHEENIWLGTLKGVYRYDGHTFDDFKRFDDKDWLR